MANPSSVFCAFGLALVALGFWLRRKESRIRDWPQVIGVIVASKVQQYRGPNYAEDVPIVEYEFPWNGGTIRSSHWRMGNFSSGFPGDADEVVARYPVGQRVTVFVNTRTPERSMLERNVPDLSLALIAIGFAIAMITLPLLIQRDHP
jgi:hypothetical protein